MMFRFCSPDGAWEEKNDCKNKKIRTYYFGH
jgi:hypothetical protein